MEGLMALPLFVRLIYKLKRAVTACFFPLLGVLQKKCEFVVPIRVVRIVLS